MNNSTTSSAAVKRHKTLHQSLIPGLSDDIAQICLNQVHPFTLFSVCHSWRKLIYSPSFPPFFCIYSLLLATNDEKKNSENFSNSVEFACFDPISSKWQLLPPPPSQDPPLRFLVKHPSFISRNIPVQTVGVSGNLILLAATADQFQPAISRPLIFNPRTRKWSYGPRLAAPRRWCAAGALSDAVYVASGVGSHYNSEVARSVVKWDLDGSNNNGPNRAQYCYCNSSKMLPHSCRILQELSIFEGSDTHPSTFLNSSSSIDNNHTCKRGISEGSDKHPSTFLKSSSSIDTNHTCKRGISEGSDKHPSTFLKSSSNIDGNHTCKRGIFEGSDTHPSAFLKSSSNIDNNHTCKRGISEGSDKHPSTFLKGSSSIDINHTCKRGIFEGFDKHSSTFLKGPSNLDSNHTCKRGVCCTKNGWKWEEMSGLKDGKFSREAIDAIGWKGKLCMVNVKGDAAKQGINYNVGMDTWQDMPEGMLVGWRGPAAAMAEETLYTVDESKGALSRYDEERDIWVEIMENEMLKGAKYLAAAGGRVCVVGGGDGGIVVVDVVAEPPRLVVVETPVGFEVLNIHVLPRMSQIG